MKAKKVLAIVSVTAVLGLAVFGCSPQATDVADTGSNDNASVADAQLAAFVEAHSEGANDAYKIMLDNGVTCEACHGMSEDELYAADAEEISVGNDACTTCHSEAKWPDELEQTMENIKDWTVYMGVGSEEHQAWVNSNMEYTTGRPLHGDWEHTCSMCHTIHEEKQQVMCTQCHNQDEGADDCETCHSYLLGDGQEFEGKTAEEMKEILKSRLPESGHVDSAMTAPEGWDAPESVSAGVKS